MGVKGVLTNFNNFSQVQLCQELKLHFLHFLSISFSPIWFLSFLYQSLYQSFEILFAYSFIVRLKHKTAHGSDTVMFANGSNIAFDFFPKLKHFQMFIIVLCFRMPHDLLESWQYLFLLQINFPKDKIILGFNKIKIRQLTKKNPWKVCVEELMKKFV